MRIAVLFAWDDRGFVESAVPRLSLDGHQVWTYGLDASSVAPLLYASADAFDRVLVLFGPGLLVDHAAQRLIDEVRLRHGPSMMSFASTPTMRVAMLPSCLTHTRVVIPEGEVISELVNEFATRSPSPAPAPVALVPMVVATMLVLGLALGLGGWWWAESASASTPPPEEEAMLVVARPTLALPLGQAVHRPGAPSADPPEPVEAEEVMPTSTVVGPPHFAVKPVRSGKHPIRMIYLPGGTFTMGRSGAAVGRYYTAHEVTVHGFWLADAEVTEAQWHEVMGTDPSDPGPSAGPDSPVQSVSWDDAVGFLNALSKRDGLLPCYRAEPEGTAWKRGCDGYRLPTEAEWEYAARAGTTTHYSFGDFARSICKHGNTSDASAMAVHRSWSAIGCDDHFVHLAPIRQYEANAWGLYDVHGNVWEWVWDRYGPYPEGPVIDEGGPTVGGYRVLRGSDYMRHPNGATVTVRTYAKPSTSDRRWGFRVARSELAAP